MQKFSAASLSFSLPESWQEITLGQFLLITNPEASDDPAFIISTLSGVPQSELRTQRGPLFEVTPVVLEHLDFISSTVPSVTEVLPETITIEGVTYPLPNDLGAEATLGQMWDIELVLRTFQKEGKPIDPPALANIILPVFLWPILTDKPYKDRYESADELWPLIEKVSCIDGLAITGFFLRSSLSPSRTGKISVTKLGQIQTKKWQRLLHQAWSYLSLTTSASS